MLTQPWKAFIDSKLSTTTQQFHQYYGDDTMRYVAFVKGDGEYQRAVRYLMDGREEVEKMIESLHKHKVITKVLDKYDEKQACSDIEKIIKLTGAKISIIDMDKWADDKDCYILRNKELDPVVDFYLGLANRAMAKKNC